jgi:UDP-N-acetylmuramoyl-tripeptide--D-alanyl-D-alanine ligase
VLSSNPEQVALAAGAELLAGPRSADARPPDRVSIDSRDVGPGVLFVGLPGSHVHGGSFAEAALAAGAWGVLTDPVHAEPAATRAAGSGAGVVLAAEDPLRSLQSLARAHRRALAAGGTRVVGVTGSTGKTSTKELIRALLQPSLRTVASRANFNTEIGLPLELLAAPPGSEVIVLEMGMRGPGQIAELAGIAEPDVGVIVSIGAVHLELLGSIEAIAGAKAELVAALPRDGVAILPADEPLLEPHRRREIRTITFGPGGEVALLEERGDSLTVSLPDGASTTIRVAFTQAHLRRNLLAAVAVAHALGARAPARLEFTPGAGRGAEIELGSGITLIDDSYNANPMSMRAALDHLSSVAASRTDARRLAVLGDMLELGPDAPDFHAGIGRHAADTADVLVAVGPLAAHIAAEFPGERHHLPDAAAASELVPRLLRPGDVVLVKGSRGIGLQSVCEALAACREDGAQGSASPRR